MGNWETDANLLKEIDFGLPAWVLSEQSFANRARHANQTGYFAAKWTPFGLRYGTLKAEFGCKSLKVWWARENSNL